MFGLTHNLYMLISALITIVLLAVFNHFIKSEKWKNNILQITSILVVIIHYSTLWVDYLSTGSAEVNSTMLFAIYPCNIIMWLLVITAFIKNKNSRLYKILSEFTAIGGIVCGIIGIVLNEIFIANPNLLDYDVLNGMLSHSVMVFGCFYLFVSGFVKLRVKNVFSCFCGLGFFIVHGGLINLLFWIAKLDACNSMYMLENPFPNLPWLSPYLMGVIALTLLFIVTAIYEQFAIKKEDRWYSKVVNKKGGK